MHGFVRQIYINQKYQSLVTLYPKSRAFKKKIIIIMQIANYIAKH